jgi:hypothetical protein
MANKLPAFLVGTECVATIGDIPIAELQAISWQEATSNQLVFGMGDYSAIANDPLQIQPIQITMRVMRYTKAAIDLCGKDALDSRKFANAIAQQANSLDTKTKSAQDGNSLAFSGSWSPAALLLESTVNIKIYARTGSGPKECLFTLHDCIANGWSIGFTPGGFAAEDYSFIARMSQDMLAEPDKLGNNP